MKSILITEPYITLGQLLKHLGTVSTGGAAKYFLRDNPVHVNGELETRRGRKIVVGDEIIILNDTYKVMDENR